MKTPGRTSSMVTCVMDRLHGMVHPQTLDRRNLQHIAQEPPPPPPPPRTSVVIETYAAHPPRRSQAANGAIQ
eukprot:COSAG01_NODE_29545_length_635_cov_0.772388_1_plen_71_part_01